MVNNKVLYIPAYSCSDASYLSWDDKKIHKHKSFTKSIRYMNEENTLGMKPYFYHPYLLMSAGFFYKVDDMREKYHIDKDCFLFLDSGGYQMKMGKLPEDFTRKTALEWCEKNGDIFPILDCPSPMGNPNIQKFREAMDYTVESAKFYYENRSNKNVKILNVISACTFSQIDEYYKKISKFKLDGWCHGGSNGSLKSILRLIFYLYNKGELFSDTPIHYHIFGLSSAKLDYYLALIQRELNKLDGVNVQLMNDSSTFQRCVSYGTMMTGYEKKISDNEFGLFGDAIKENISKSVSVSNRYDYSNVSSLIPSLTPIFNDPLLDVEEFFNTPVVYKTMIGLNNLWWVLHKKEFVDRLVNFGCDDVMFSFLDSDTKHNFKEIIKIFKNPKYAFAHIDTAIRDIKTENKTKPKLNF